MHTNIRPRTFSAGLPHVVVTSTSGSVRPIAATVWKLVGRSLLEVSRAGVRQPSRSVSYLAVEPFVAAAGRRIHRIAPRRQALGARQPRA